MLQQLIPYDPIINRSLVRPKVLWIMRHGAIPEQTKFLENMLGQKIIYNYLESDKLSLNDIINCINRFKPTEIVAVLPIDMIISLMNLGIYPLHSIMENTNDPQNCDVVFDGFKCRNFIGFRRYNAVKTFYFPNLNGKFVMNPTAGFIPSSNKILLFSYKRSRVSALEKNDLEQLYGKELIFVSKGQNTDLKKLAQSLKDGEYLDVIIEAPKSVLNKMTDLGINPLIAQTNKIFDETSFDIEHTNGAKFKYLGFKRLWRLYIEYSNPLITNIYGQRKTRQMSLSKRTFN